MAEQISNFDFKQKRISPVGQLVGWTAISEPSAYENSDPAYSCRLAMDPSDPDVQEFIALITEAQANAADYLDWVATKYGNSKPLTAVQKKNLAALPFEPEVDETGEVETGRIIAKFRIPAEVYAGGSKIPHRIAVVDAKRQPCTDVVYSGSTVKISAQVKPWFVSSKGVGVTLRPFACQVLELVSSNQEVASSGTEGFGIEDGFETAPRDESVEATDGFEAVGEL